ncbi:HEAT repeat domain-containing protein, partial [bacterium]|nr:HEAT repeat domain-containing protein [bacterium]
RNAALIGLGKAGSAKDADTLVAALDGADAERGAATDALLLLEGKDATAAIAAKAEGAKAPAKAILVGVLGQRGDAAAVPAVVAAAKDKAEAVRVAAYGALGALKSEAGIEALLGALLSEKAATRDRAEWAFSRIPGDAATQAILKALDGLQAQAEAKVVLVRSLGYRRDARTLDRLAALTRDPVDDVRAAAFRALAMLNDLRAIPAILKALETEKGKARDAAVYALRRAHGKEATAAIVKAAKTAPAAALAPILRVLSWRDDPAVQQFLVANASNGDATVRAAALDGLSRIKDAAAVPSIIEAATKGEGQVRNAAIRTSLVYTDEITKADPAAAKAIYLRALDHKVVPHHDARRAALRALGKVGDADTVGPLADALRDRRLSGDAHGAIENIARRLVKAGQKDQGIAALLTMARRSNDHGRIRRAQQELKKLGVQGELPLAVGFVTHWHVCGPFPNPKNALFGAALPPEKDGKADVTKPVAAGGTTCAWKPFLSTDAAGVVDLERELKKNDEQAALLYAEVSVAEAADVVLRLGYDEGCIAYVNGKKVHSRSGSRWRVDDQRAKAKLVAGTNTVLLKITNLGPGWRASCRIIGVKNEAVPFTQGGK